MINKKDHLDNSLNTSSVDYSAVIKSNISRYDSREDFFSEDINSSKYKSSLDKESIKNNYKKFLFNAWETPINWDSFDNWFLLYSWEDYDNIKNIIFTRNITPELQRHIYLFLQSFIDYCNELSWEALKCFCQNFLSWSDNMFNYLPNEYKFLIISQLLRNDELHHIRTNFIWEFHYEFIFSEQERLERLLEEVDKWGEVVAINNLNMLSIVISHLWWYEEDSLADNVRYICERISERYNNPFFRYKVKSLQEDVDYMILNYFPPATRNDLTRTNNVEFEGDNNWYTVKIASDYVSYVSNMWYSKALANYEWKDDELNNSGLNDTYELYTFLERSFSFLENMHMDLSQNDAERVYSYMDKMYYNQIDANDVNLKEVFINLLWDDSWNRLYDIFISSIEERRKQNEIFNEFVEQAREEYGDPISSPEYDLMCNRLNNWVNNFLNNDIYLQIQLVFNSTPVIRQESNKVLLKGYSYNKALSSSEIDIYGLMDIEESSIFMQEMHTPEMIYMINSDLWIDITKLSLQNQAHLLRFLWEQTIEEFDQFKETLYSIQNKDDKYSFLTTFLACSENLELWEKIIELASYPGAEKIFKAYSNLVKLQLEVHENIDLLSFLRVILTRGRWLLEDALVLASAWEDLRVDNKYEASLVKSWAFVKALFNSTWKNEIISMDDFNEKSPDFEASTFTWWKLIKSWENIDMLIEDNYLESEKFNVEDYYMLLENIYNTYTWIDNELIKILYKDIPEDLNNPNVKFYMMREKSEGWKPWKLLALCKITKKDDGSIYWWTHYVEPDYRWNFGIWSYIAKLAFKDFEKHDINAIVAKNNPSLEAQINYSAFVGTSLDTDKWHSMESDLMIWIHLYRNKTFKTKNSKEYPDFKLRNQIWENDWYEVLEFDSRPWFDENYVSVLNEKLSNGEIITRIFYDRKDKEANLEKTYVVFEKIPEEKTSWNDDIVYTEIA